MVTEGDSIQGVGFEGKCCLIAVMTTPVALPIILSASCHYAHECYSERINVDYVL